MNPDSLVLVPWLLITTPLYCSEVNTMETVQRMTNLSYVNRETMLVDWHAGEWSEKVRHSEEFGLAIK